MSRSSQPLESSKSTITEKRTIAVPLVSQAYSPRIDVSKLYVYTLKLLLLEYINEPRFRKFQTPVGPPPSAGAQQPPPLVRRTPRISNEEENSRILQISNGFKSASNKVIREGDCLQDTLPRLGRQLSRIAIKKINIEDENLRRSLLKFYNDMFLNPSMRPTLDSMERFEELIIHFTKAANGELNKLVVNNLQKELHSQISFFIDLAISVSKNLPDELVTKLQQYKESSTPRRHRFGKRSIPSNDMSTTTSRSTSSSLTSNADKRTVIPKPTFRLEEITHSGFFKELFEVDDIKLQQDVIKVIKEPLADIYCKELRILDSNIREGKGGFKIEEFPSEKDYNLWANIELSEIAYLMDKFNPEDKFSNPTSVPYSMIPEDPRDAFVALICQIFKHGNSVSMNALNLSQSALFFLQRASKCWRLEFFSTLSCLIYTAANLTILEDSELNEKLTENVLHFIQSKILRSELHMDTSMWNDVDQRQWIVNLCHASNQCVTSTDNLLSALYAATKPKFSPVLSFYYTYIEADPAMILFKTNHGDDLDAKLKKKLRSTISKASKHYYISLLDKVPKDKSIEIQHVQNVAELIIKEIQSIQKRYNKPLLDVINLSFESASFLIEAFAADVPTMLERVEKYAPVGPVDALEMYDVLKELRNIYVQVKPKKSFPINLEKLFAKYLTQLCDEVSEKVLRVIKESLKNENWRAVNPEVPYSTSVVDIFRMINESIGLFKRVEWQNSYQIAKIITFLLKSFSDGLHYYASSILKMIEEDLSDDSSEFIFSDDEIKENNNAGSEKTKNSWVSGMRNALRNSQPLDLPKPYQFKSRTCILLNDLNSIIGKLNELDSQLNLEELSNTIKQYESKHQKTKGMSNNLERQLHQLYTIRVIGAENIRGFSSIDGLSNPVLSLVDTSRQREIAKTKIIRRSVNPVWDEEFEIEIPVGNTRTIALTVWHRPSGKLSHFSYDVCGKCSFFLDSKRYTDDGFPNAATLSLDTQGKVFLEISLESEKLDAVFCIGRAYRTMSRALDRAIELITNKFSAFVNFAFSRATLKTVCGSSGTAQSPKDTVYDAIVPLFDYLNANLNILASELTQPLLFRIMLREWSSILAAADGLLLPSLSMAKIKKMQSTKSLWGNAMHALGNSSVVGYGRPLTQREIEVVFIWLNALCVDFFHNDGEGPPLSDLKNKYYQMILLIPVYYDQDVAGLKREAERLAPEYTKYLQQKTLGSNSSSAATMRSKTIARKKTIIANATRKNRKQAELDVQNDESDPLERSAETLDIVLRTLMAKDEVDYVQKQLHSRKKMRKSLATERKVQAAVRGQKIK